MNASQLNFLNRLTLAFRTCWGILTDPVLAGKVLQLAQGKVSVSDSAGKLSTPAPLKESSPDAALQLLALLQQEGRFIDFLEENVTAYSDAEIGGAARVVHEGCRKIIHNHLKIEAVRKDAEGERVTLPAGFDAMTIRLTGNVVGEPPFTGTLMHRGWQVTGITLPKMTERHDVRILAPAEIEL
ncbi:MAG: hypothetical protein CSA09_01665 [Candidatus Contendobacter odensis]|uniref:DUF2760 domain-containing protein n=1 Tax=Candidatus Contendibacter odensensis TaxID=1400860 RepID=A0A2G6PG86_9GAMM|nr:MAG: hypothetical protein CSA09_01665 [Candidatus Contendobacter odensis]